MVGVRGSVAIEGAAVVFLLVLAVAFHLEIIRRAGLTVTLQHAAFRFVRARALGVAVRASRAELRAFLRRSFGGERGDAINRKLEIEEKLSREGLETHLRYRYPSFLRFEMSERYTKHHFQLTEICKFRY
jgi:hypothetical protein